MARVPGTKSAKPAEIATAEQPIDQAAAVTQVAEPVVEPDTAAAASEPVAEPVAAEPVPTPAPVPDPVPVAAEPEAVVTREPKRVEPQIAVRAPAGDRRRAGLAFGREPIYLTRAALAAGGRDADDVLAELMADPMLAVTPHTPPDPV